MSYDFRLFLDQPGIPPIVIAKIKPGKKTSEINPGPPVAAKEERKTAIADALMKADPSLVVFPFGFDVIANIQKISVDEAKIRYRHMELNGRDNGTGIQITLFDDNASLTVPYWHKDERAKIVFAQLWEYLKIIQAVSGYQIYDPQLDCIVNLASDLEKATKRYLDVVSRVIGKS